MNSRPVELKIVPGEMPRAGEEWLAQVDFDDMPAYDGHGQTIELALANLALSLALALHEREST